MDNRPGVAVALAELEARLKALSADDPAQQQERIDGLNELAWALRFDDTPRANALASEARELAQSRGYKLGQARACRVLGMTTSSEQTLTDVIRFAEEAKTLFDEVGEPEGMAASRDFLATIYEYVGDHSLGMEHAVEALRLAREIGHAVRQGYALSNIGGILAKSGDVDGALERLMEALALFETTDEHSGTTRICQRLSEINRTRGDLEAAERYARRALHIAQTAGSEDDEASMLAELGEVEKERGNWSEAESLLRRTIDFYSDDDPGAVSALSPRLTLAGLLMKRGELDQAEDILRAALAHLHRFGLPVPASEADAHKALAAICEQKGQLEKANSHLREVIEMRERAADKEMRNKLAQYEAKAEMQAARQDAEIHRLKYVELAQMQAKLVQAEKMAQLGTFAAGTTHELNTPLGVLRSNLNLIATAATRLSDLVPAEERTKAEKLVAAINSCGTTSTSALERISGVAERFKRFTSLDLAEKRVFNVVEGLQSAIELLRPEIPTGIHLESDLQPVPDIEGWPAQLNQTFMTVLLNATEAIESEGRVCAETRLDGDWVVVRISDTGRGMSDSERAHLFDVGWSAEGKRTKMRLGLSAAHATVQHHGGVIDVASSLGQGTVFTLRFPTGSR